MSELTFNWRAQNDPEFAEFILDLRLVKDGGKPNFQTYTSNKCRKSLSWTNKTRRFINNKWMLEESKNFFLNNIEVLNGLPIICKKTMTVDKQELKNNEEFEVINIDAKTIEIKN